MAVHIERHPRTWRIFLSITNPATFGGHDMNNFIYVRLPKFELTLIFVVVAFSAGQFTSMLIRSGIMAGFCGVLLSGVLCVWVCLMLGLQVPFWWSVLPIPVVLLWATWRRAPDWINENTTWRARLRLNGSVLVPFAALLVAVPYYRVNHIAMPPGPVSPAAAAGMFSAPHVPLPGFDPTAYLAGIDKQALETGELYRKASEKFVSVGPKEVTFPSSPAGRHLLSQYLEANAGSLDLLLEASQRPSCALDNPATMKSLTGLAGQSQLISLVKLSAATWRGGQAG